MASTPLDDLADPLSTPVEQNPEQRVLRSERGRLLQAGLDRLTERERIALVLRDVEDMPAEEVAKILNCGKATVRSHIANARVKFRKYLEGRRA